MRRSYIELSTKTGAAEGPADLKIVTAMAFELARTRQSTITRIILSFMACSLAVDRLGNS